MELGDTLKVKKTWFIEYSKNQKYMLIKGEKDIRNRPHPDWKLVETFFGTMHQANERADTYFERITQSGK